MKILVIGGGGREHALAWKAAQSADVDCVYVAPGNAGTAREPNVENIPIGAEDIEGLLDFARRNQVALTIVGPEAPLVAGIVDRFTDAGLPCFGPHRESAQLEGSKSFCKAFLARHNIPTARHAVFNQAEPAIDYVRECGTPLVIKADGLAAGKGVVIARHEGEAVDVIRGMLSGNSFGEAGRRVVVEEFLEGEEASIIVMSDGNKVLPMATSQDHKARDDGDKGPNTGGMGAYSPAPVISPGIDRRIMQQVIEPTLRGMAHEGRPYVGFLYAGIMLSADGTPNVLEFNCRFGDPEAQPVLMRLRSDLVGLCKAALAGKLDETAASWDPRPAVGVVMAAGGYPEAYRKGDVVTGLDSVDDERRKVFHAGTVQTEGKILTNGGRVLCVTALGDDVALAQRHAYDGVNRLSWPDAYFRTDIAYRAIDR